MPKQRRSAPSASNQVVTLIYRKGLKLDGHAPAWISKAATSSGKPILLRVDYDAGHSMGSTRSQQDREAADTYAFLLWQLRGPGRS